MARGRARSGEHQLLRADAVGRGGEPVVPDERHPLDERARGADHPVEPPEVVVAPGVVGRERAALVVVRRRADERSRAAAASASGRRRRARARERRRLALPGPEAGTPEQALGLPRRSGLYRRQPPTTVLSAGRGFSFT